MTLTPRLLLHITLDSRWMFPILFDWCCCYCPFIPLVSRIIVEKTVRNGYKTTKLQLNQSLNEITSRIELLMNPLAKVLSAETFPGLIENNNVIKSITLNRQCERFLYDLLNTLTEHQTHIERCLKNYRSQLNRIHETVKFRTAIPISSIFVSIWIIC